jgi:hypothetical protein
MENFREDVVGTVLFCFLACLGALVLAVQAKGWHGLCPYGGRLRRNRSHALAAALFILAYALYFSDPQHRNVRNIEGFMSLVSLVIGAVLAAAFLAFSASLAEEVRRWFLRRKALGGWPGWPPPQWQALEVEGAGEVLFTEGWSGGKEDLLAVMEPVPASRHLALAIASHLRGRRLAFLLPALPGRRESTERRTRALQDQVSRLVGALGEKAGREGSGCRVLVVGDASRIFLPRWLPSPGPLEAWRPSKVVILAPPLREPGNGALTDSLISNTPLDLLRALPGEGGVAASSLRAFLGAWLVTFLLILPAAVLLPFLFRARWWFLSGPAGALVASFWLSFHLRNPFREREEAGEGMNGEAPAYPSCFPGTEEDTRYLIVIGSDELASPREPSAKDPSAINPALLADLSVLHAEVIREPRLLRGKLFSWPSFPAKLEEWIWG